MVKALVLKVLKVHLVFKREEALLNKGLKPRKVNFCALSMFYIKKIILIPSNSFTFGKIRTVKPELTTTSP